MAASTCLSPRHHVVFDRFEPHQAEVTAHYHIDFLGMRTRGQFKAGLPMVHNPSIMIDDEYFEWIDLLESVVEARESYTMIDLGAGYGRWAVRAACAVRQYHHELPYRLIAVEAEPIVFQWMGLHFADNGINPAEHRLIHAAVRDARGKALFYIGGPRGGPFDRGPDDWHGHRLTKDYDVSSKSTDDGRYSGFRVRRHESGWRSIKVPCVTLGSLLKDLERVDLIDMDIEGQELPSIRSTIEELNAKVKRIHIGTHGKEIECELRQLLSSHGWTCLADYSLFSKSQTPWGMISFENGVQSWVNPRLKY
jgi:FkbM family methyltransferase